jgi:hypothetical protein
MIAGPNKIERKLKEGGQNSKEANEITAGARKTV